jgi:hypothetical protein
MFEFARNTFLGVIAASAIGMGSAEAVTFTLDANGGTGQGLDLGPAPGYDYGLSLVSNNTAASIFTTWTATAAFDAIVSVDWNYFTADIDGSTFDKFGYFIDDVFTTLVQLSTDGIPKPAIQGGSTSFFVAEGSDFGFYFQNIVGGLGAANATMAGNVDVAPIPLPAGGLLLIGAIGGLAALRRRKSA